MRDDLRAKRRQFVFDPLFNREMKPRSDVGGSGGFENDWQHCSGPFGVSKEDTRDNPPKARCSNLTWREETHLTTFGSHLRRGTGVLH